MRKIYLKIKQTIVLVIALGAGNALTAQSVTTYSYSGSLQTFTVPNCVTSITFDVRGAEGGDVSGSVSGWQNGNVSLSGGNGGRAVAVLTVTPGEVLNLYVGGKGTSTSGGFNGGGNTGTSCGGTEVLAAGGGGATDVRRAGTALSNRIIVAGGGGGVAGSASTSYQANTNSGAGGGLVGAAATGGASGACLLGQGGTQTAGGAGGNNTCWCSLSNVAQAGSLGLGGNSTCAPSGLSTCSCGGTGCTSGGGGGGGYYGGGGGLAYQGGGGGSSWVEPTATSVVHTQGYQTGNGEIVLSYGTGGLPVITSPSTLALCSGNTATLTASGASSYTWLATGTFTGSNASTIAVTPTANTVYTVQGVNNLGCVLASVIPVTVYNGVPQLTVANTASATSGICPSKTVALTASGAVTYTWTGATPVTNGVAFSPTTTSGYTVTGENACGTTTAATSVSIHASPTTGTVISQPTLCSGQTVTLTGVGNATNYVWSGGVPNGGTFYPPVTASFTVTGTSAQGCTSTAVAFLTVVTTPVAQPLAAPPLICIGKSSTLTAVGASNYTWTTPTGTLGTPSIVVSPTVTTTYVITKANSNCVNTQSVTVIVNQLPQISGVANPSIACAGKTLQLQAVGAQTYTWTGPAFTSTLNSPITSATVSTIYTLTASDGTCSNVITVPLTVNPNPIITVVATTSAICRGDSVTMDASGGLTYTWTTPTGTLSGQTIKESPASNTLYVVTGVNQYTCYTSASQVVIVNPTPTLNVQTTKPLVCPNGVSSLTVSGANTYSWDANTGGATGNIISVNPSVTTVYTATGYFVPTMCFSTKTIQVNVFQPTFATNSPTSSCFGGTINLIASGAISYTWNGTQPFSQIAVSPPTPTFYVVSATSGSNGVNCVSTQTVQVSIYVNPTITAAADRTLICKGEIVKLTGGGGTTYNWGNNVFGTTVAFSPQVNTPYYVIGTDQNGCIGTSSINIKVSPCIGIGELNNIASNLSVYPNPNSGTFIINGSSEIKLEIVNELGQQIKTVHLTSSTNYQANLTGLAPGIYFLRDTNSGLKISEKIVITK